MSLFVLIPFIFVPIGYILMIRSFEKKRSFLSVVNIYHDGIMNHVYDQEYHEALQEGMQALIHLCLYNDQKFVDIIKEKTGYIPYGTAETIKAIRYTLINIFKNDLNVDKETLTMNLPLTLGTWVMTYVKYDTYFDEGFNQEIRDDIIKRCKEYNWREDKLVTEE